MFGIAVNVFAVCFGIIIFVFSFFPAAMSVTPDTMNYSVLMTFSVLVFAVVYYFLYARKEFTGPIVEVMPYVDSTQGSGGQTTVLSHVIGTESK